MRRPTADRPPKLTDHAGGIKVRYEVSENSIGSIEPGLFVGPGFFLQNTRFSIQNWQETRRF